mmetsp:Transcript_22226/g.50741  ORF Transcript_22226/g.50741 Transcript_22226/m.50741 type:complete len:185 (-) Transcript_22226:128-682(-)
MPAADPRLPTGVIAVHKRDWVAGWDAHPVVAAPPRWTLGGSDLSNAKSSSSRLTYTDHHNRAVSWVPGPGTYRRERLWDENLREEIQKEMKDDGSHHYERVTRSVAPRFSRALRATSSGSKYGASPKGRVPTSFYTPGPGAYTAFSTFGSPSGPSRKRYLCANKADNSGHGRTPEEYTRSSAEH